MVVCSQKVVLASAPSQHPSVVTVTQKKKKKSVEDAGEVAVLPEGIDLIPHTWQLITSVTAVLASSGTRDAGKTPILIRF